MGTRKDPSLSSRDAEPESETTTDGTPAGCKSIAGMKPGWLFRWQDRAILHRPTADAEPRVIGTVPRVLGRVVHLTDDGQDIRSEYLVMGKRQRRPRILTEDELDRGTWAAKTGNRRPTGNDERHAFARLIREAGDKAPEIFARTYYNDGGDLILPDADAQTHGYRTLRGSEDDARRAWGEIGSWMERDGRAALVAGAFFAGPVLDSLDMLAHMVSVHGAGQLGKSTILTVCAASFGDIKPRGQQLMMTWNASKQGITQGLRQRGYLPVALDEHSSSGRTIKDSSREISQMVAGAIRAMGTADGSPRESDGFWHSVILSSSNEPLKFEGQTEDLASRLQEFQAPFFPNVMVTPDGRPAGTGEPRAEHLSKRLKRLARDHGGWPIEWAVGAGAFRAENLAQLRQLHMELCARHRQAQGGIAATIAELHMAWVVGAHMLGTAIGAPALGAVAEAEAAARLADAIEIAAEANTPDHEKLWNALDALRIEAAAFPEMERLPVVASESLRPPKGFHRSELGEWWVIDPVVRAAAVDAGIDNLTAALRALDRLRVHVRGDGKHSQRQTPKQLRGEHMPRRMHCFDLRRAGEIFAPDDAPEDGGPTPLPCGPTPGPTPDPPGVGPENMPLTSAGPTGPTGPTPLPLNTYEESPRTVPGTGTHLAAVRQDVPAEVPDGAVMVGPHGPVMRLDGWEPCRGCGNPAPYRDDLGPVHPGGECWEPRTADSAPSAAESGSEWPDVPAPPDEPIGVPVPRTAPDSAAPAVERRRHVVAALDSAGLWVEGEDAPRPVTDRPVSRAAVVELALAAGVDRLWLYPDSAPADLPDRMGPDAPALTHPWAALAGTPFTTGAAGDDATVRPYAVIRRRDDSDRSVVLCLARLDPVFEGAPLPAPAELVAGHRAFNREFGTWWFVSEPHMFRSLLERHIDRTKHAAKVRRVESIATMRIPAVGQTSLMSRDSRPLTAAEDGCLFLTGFDRNAAWPTAMTATTVGFGEPRHITEPFRFDPAVHGKLAGYWRMADDVWIDPRIDDMLHLGAGWLTTGEARMLARGIKTPSAPEPESLLPEIVEAWVWDDSAELFQGFGRTVRNARKALIAHRRERGGEVALTLQKSMASAFGALSTGIGKDPAAVTASERGRLWRPDWQDQIRGQGQANIIREVLTIGKTRDRWPVALNVDEMVYATNHADPADAARELGIRYDATGAAGNGWKSKGPVSIAAAGRHAGEGSFWPMFRKLREEGK